MPEKQKAKMTLICSKMERETNPKFERDFDQDLNQMGKDQMSEISDLSNAGATDHYDDKNKGFPQKLMEILKDESISHIIGWLPSGRSFIVKDRARLSREVLPRYFDQGAEYRSFTRRLRRWGFRRITKGPETNAYQHTYFQKGKEELCRHVTWSRTRTQPLFTSKPRAISKNVLAPPACTDELSNNGQYSAQAFDVQSRIFPSRGDIMIPIGHRVPPYALIQEKSQLANLQFVPPLAHINCPIVAGVYSSAIQSAKDAMLRNFLLRHDQCTAANYDCALLMNSPINKIDQTNIQNIIISSRAWQESLARKALERNINIA